MKVEYKFMNELSELLKKFQLQDEKFTPLSAITHLLTMCCILTKTCRKNDDKIWEEAFKKLVELSILNYKNWEHNEKI